MQANAVPRPSSLVTDAAQIFLNNSFQDGTGRIKVRIHLNGDTDVAAVRSTLEGKRWVQITSTITNYRKGVIEGWMNISDSANVAKARGVQSVLLEQLPNANVGSVKQQGLVQHRVDTIPQFDGTGITIGALSDSYGITTIVTPAADVTSDDLPGTGNPLGNTQPVVILQDFTSGADEGRAMLQVIHDMAPKARLGFTTANGGQANFANNIRALANLSGAVGAEPGFKADVIVDDIVYLIEPMFSDGIIGQAVNEVVAAGISYFSSAGNRPSANGYSSDYRAATGTTAAIAATSSIDLTGVSPALYPGGFHNFRTDGTVDVAQTLRRTAGSGNSNTLIFQWDDPFDFVVPGTQIFSQAANFTGVTQTYPVILTAGTPTRVTAIAAFASSFDAVVTILDPSSTVVLSQDTGTDETVLFTPSVTGSYTIQITAFGGTTGLYSVAAYANSAIGMTTQYNVLFFRADTGAFISSFSQNAFQVNEAFQLGTIPFPTGQSAIQIVFSRGTTPAPLANRLRYVIFDSNTAITVPAEYTSYQYPTTYGHNCARDGFGVAAYSAFRPRIPEGFTSPGPSTVAFDDAGNRLATPEIRKKPDIAAMDGANNTFFVSDSVNDADGFPNFFGTSCAAPNAAACAALVLQAKGGPGSLTPRQMKAILQSTALQHDLDPNAARAQIRTRGGKLTVIVNADPSNTSGGQPVVNGTFDPNVVSVNYVGTGAIKTLKFDLTTGNTTGGNETLGLVSGLAWDSRAVASGGLPFTLGRLTGLVSGDIVSAFSSPSPAPSVVGQFLNFTLTFTDNVFTGGKAFGFNCDRDEFQPASLTPGQVSAGGNSADLWGGQFEIPGGVFKPGGVVVSGTMQDGSTFSGMIVNSVGRGYSPLDGYGMIDAAAAVVAPVPVVP